MLKIRKSCGFPSFYYNFVFCISVSSLAVCLYSYCSSAENFRSKSLCPRALCFRLDPKNKMSG